MCHPFCAVANAAHRSLHTGWCVTVACGAPAQICEHSVCCSLFRKQKRLKYFLLTCCFRVSSSQLLTQNAKLACQIISFLGTNIRIRTRSRHCDTFLRLLKIATNLLGRLNPQFPCTLAVLLRKSALHSGQSRANSALACLAVFEFLDFRVSCGAWRLS